MMHVSTWIYGHTHWNRLNKIQGCTVVSNQCGGPWVNVKDDPDQCTVIWPLRFTDWYKPDLTMWFKRRPAWMPNIRYSNRIDYFPPGNLKNAPGRVYDKEIARRKKLGQPIPKEYTEAEIEEYRRQQNIEWKEWNKKQRERMKKRAAKKKKDANRSRTNTDISSRRDSITSSSKPSVQNRRSSTSSKTPQSTPSARTNQVERVAEIPKQPPKKKQFGQRAKAGAKAYPQPSSDVQNPKRAAPKRPPPKPPT